MLLALTNNIYNKLGNIDSAIISYKNAVNINPNYDKGHYDFHRDIGTGDEIMKARVNVGILQLSDHKAYKGGTLQLKHKDQIIDVIKRKRMVTTFPIDMEHRVTPVTSGVRKTLIMWGLV